LCPVGVAIRNCLKIAMGVRSNSLSNHRVDDL
jgi:hypothetical protein